MVGEGALLDLLQTLAIEMAAVGRTRWRETVRIHAVLVSAVGDGDLARTTALWKLFQDGLVALNESTLGYLKDMTSLMEKLDPEYWASQVQATESGDPQPSDGRVAIPLPDELQPWLVQLMLTGFTDRGLESFEVAHRSKCDDGESCPMLEIIAAEKQRRGGG